MTFPWNKLPAELQNLIFLELYWDPERCPEHHVLAKCASVCRAWQVVFEPYVFDVLVLSQKCLPRFRNAVRGRKKQYRFSYIRTLLLRVRLDEYDCSVCQTVEDDKTIEKNCRVFTNAVYSLLTILATWNRHIANVSAGLHLEISIYSPSDCKHVFRPFCLQDDYPFHAALPPSLDAGDTNDHDGPFYRRHAEEATFHDPPHGWTRGAAHAVPNPSGSQVGNPSGKDRLFGTRPLDFDFHRIWANSRSGSYYTGDGEMHLPMAGIVRSFALRRASFRSFTPKVLFKLLHESFTHIKEVRVERWLDLYTDQQIAYDQELQQELSSKGLPETLRHLYLVQEEDPSLHHCKAGLRGTSDPFMLGFHMARASRDLESLALTWKADAATFFHELVPRAWHGVSPGAHSAAAPWRHLRTLTLTCTRLGPDLPLIHIRQLLGAALVAAWQMPQLQRLQIRNCGSGAAAVFLVDLRPAWEKEHAPGLRDWDILWMSTWDVPFPAQHKVFDGWRDLARQRLVPRRESDVGVFSFTLPPEKLESRWGLLDLLSQKSHMLHPISLHEIMWETFRKYSTA